MQSNSYVYGKSIEAAGLSDDAPTPVADDTGAGESIAAAIAVVGPADDGPADDADAENEIACVGPCFMRCQNIILIQLI